MKIKNILFIFIFSLCFGSGFAEVKVWEEDLMLPSYRLNPADPNPMFYLGETYQGAQKRIYPYPLMDGITSEKITESFKAVYLENEYIKLCVLPEIGGRLFYATDKTNGYNFFYKQTVIKPALIGMLGAWISGGVEWCVFHHHRNTTHMPVDYTTTENPNGSKTIWIGETERRHRMRWLIGITLHPGKSFVQVNVKMINRTELPHSILYWANVAVHVNDEYQIIFPPDLQVAAYHQKNDFVNWPIGKGYYQRSNYDGVDLSWWKNHPRPVSCFAWDVQEDFMGGYDFSQEAGVVHVGNHHIVRGAKLWEWAPGNIWDTQVLTDSDGPYAELMVGAFSDNQPDYSWIKPYEVKEFSQYWYPIREIGGFKNANLNAAMNLELSNGKVNLGIHPTSPLKDAQVTLFARGEKIAEITTDISPGNPYVSSIKVEKDIKRLDLHARLVDNEGTLLIEYQPVELNPVGELPETVKAPPQPEDIPTVEELYLTGMRVQQIYKPSIDPMIYYEEALDRDPNDVRTNTVVGINYSRRFMFEKAGKHLRRAVERLTIDYTRPSDTEAFFHLGLSLKALGKLDEAYKYFYKSVWDYEYFSTGYFQLASLACRNGNLPEAYDHINLSLSTNANNTKAINVKTAILRRTGKRKEAMQLCDKVLTFDPLDFFAQNEKLLLKIGSGDAEGAELLRQEKNEKMRGDAQNYLELATDYMSLGFYIEAIDVLKQYELSKNRLGSYPLVSYYLGYLLQQIGKEDLANTYFQAASQLDDTYCFPFREETINVLNAALQKTPNDSRALYYLGNLLYEFQPEKAIDCWEKARETSPSFAIVNRNLGWAYLRFQKDMNAAIASYKKAIECNPNDPRYYLELDDLYQRDNTDPIKRLAVLDNNPSVISKRKDLLIRHIDLSVKNGKYDKAIKQLSENMFFISEGGGRELGNAYVNAYLLRGLVYLKNNQSQMALQDFQAASFYPENLSQESVRNESKMAQVKYYIAQTNVTLGKKSQAKKQYQEIVNSTIPSRRSEAIYYQVLAMQELGQKDKAKVLTENLISSAKSRIEEQGDIDFFAKFGEQQTNQARLADAHYALGLGLLLQNKSNEAKKEFDLAISFDKSHVWAKYQLVQLLKSQ